MAPHCPAIDNPDSIWPPFCPNIISSGLFAALFGIITFAHLVQMFYHRKGYSWVILFSAALQTATYVLRTLSIRMPDEEQLYSDWFILMMVAPIWTNAYVYMVMGRMVYNFTPSASVFKVKAWRFGLIFVLLDVFAFLVQLGGAAVAGVNDDEKTAMLGIHIYMGGIGFQQLCIFAFLALAIRLHKKLLALQNSTEKRNGLLLLYINYTVVILITVRIIFRLIEYSAGFESTIPLQEAYQYVFDSTVMMIALVLYNIFHPGRMMPGADANLPSRKVRKQWKKMGEAPRGRVGEESLLPKYQSPSVGASREASPSPEAVDQRDGYALVGVSGSSRAGGFESGAQAEEGYLHPEQAALQSHRPQEYEPYGRLRP